MPNKRTELLKWGKFFISEMKNSDIWFSADVDMILGAQRHGGFIPWNERIQVIMSPESYAKLRRLYPNNVIDSYYSTKYKSFKGAFVNDRDDWKKEQPFIEIRIVVPTTLKKIKEFRKLKRVIKRKEVTIKSAINELFDVCHEGFYVIEKRTTRPIKSWIPNITFKVIEMKFNGLKVPVIKEWKFWVTAVYGRKYMKAVIPSRTYVYPSPLKITREGK